MEQVNLTPEFITTEWSKDCRINPNAYVEEAVRAMNQRSKYLIYLSHVNENLIELDKKLRMLKIDLYKYYSVRGVMTQDEMNMRGWDYDPYKGLTPPKTKENKELFIKANETLMELEADIRRNKDMKDILLIILDMIKNQSFMFSNISRSMEN